MMMCIAKLPNSKFDFFLYLFLTDHVVLRLTLYASVINPKQTNIRKEDEHS